MLEQRVTKLEEDMGRISAVLERLEPKITEILLTGAKQADLHRTQLEVAELRGRMSALEEKLGGRIGALEEKLGGQIAKLDGRMTSVEERLGGQIARLDGRIVGVEGRMGGLDARIAMLPTVWTQLGLIFATWGIGSGLIIFTMTRMLAK